MVEHVLKHAWHALRHAPDRALHSLRRRRVARLVRGRIPKSVVFVCQGNICRSPFAAALFERLAAERLPVPIATSSRGFSGPGRGSPAAAVSAAARRGFDLSAHRSRLVTSKAIRATELVVVMSIEQARMIHRVGDRATRAIVLGDLDPGPISARTIVDPWGEPEAVFDESYDRIDRCVRELVRLMADAAEARPLDRFTRASSEGTADLVARDTSPRELPR